MLNWIKFITAFLLTLFTVIAIAIFYTANKPISEEKNKAVEAAKRTGQIETILDVQPYNGTTSLVTVFGENPSGEKVAVFVDDSKDDKFEEVKLTNGISAEQAMEIVLKEQKADEVMHVLLGIEDNEPIWEVAFKNEHGKLNYVYIQFQDGEWVKRILNL